MAPYLGALGVVGIVYGALACLAQRDLKRLIAYSSVGHMGFVLLAISTLTRAGRAGARTSPTSPTALITGLLFFLVGAVKDRTGSTDFAAVGRGLYGRAPHLAAVFAFGGDRESRAARTGRLLGRDAGDAGGVLAGARPAAHDVPRLHGARRRGRGAHDGVLRAACPPHLPGRRREQPDADPDVELDEWVAWSPLRRVMVVLGMFPVTHALVGRRLPSWSAVAADDARAIDWWAIAPPLASWLRLSSRCSATRSRPRHGAGCRHRVSLVGVAAALVLDASSMSTTAGGVLPARPVSEQSRRLLLDRRRRHRSPGG